MTETEPREPEEEVDEEGYPVRSVNVTPAPVVATASVQVAVPEEEGDDT